MMRRMHGLLSFYTLGLALGFSALAAGAIHLPVLVVFALLVVASAGVLVRGSEPGVRAPAGAFMAVACALALFCLLQALPLPLRWVEALAPQNADVWARAFKPLQLPPPELASISLAPGRTVIKALELASCAVVFGVAAHLSRAHGAHRVLALVSASALAVAIVTAGHQLAGAERLYGQYKPLDAYSVAPLLNPNNRAGYLNLGFFCGLGLLFRSGSRPYLGLLGLGSCFIAAQVLLCRSLGGTACLALGGAAVVLLGLPGTAGARGPRLALRPWARAGVLAAIGLGAALLAWAGRGSSTLGLDDRSSEKLALWRRASRVALDHWGFGIGRGAFASVFPAYQDQRNVVFEHAENFPLQWAAEWGIPATVIALLALGVALRSVVGRRTRQSPTRLCALIGCGVLLLQNLADLALEVPAVAALLCCALGALVGGSQKGASTANPGMGRARLLASSALVLVCGGLALRFGTDSPSRLRHALHAELSAHSGPPPAAFWAHLEQAVRSYPAEPYFPLLGASAARAAGKNPLGWVARALERHPESAAAHLQLAHILRARGATSQALGALRRAIELDPALARSVPRLADEWQLSLPEFEAAAPLGRAGAPLLLSLAERTEDVALRLHLLEESLARDPTAADAHHRLALELLQDVGRKESGVTCAGQKEACLARAAGHLQRGKASGDSRTLVLEARLLAESGEPQSAERHLAEGCVRFPSDVPCLRAWVARALANGSPHVQDAVQALVAAGCTGPEGCAATHLGLGTLFANAGRLHQALSHYQHAARESPSPETWRAVASTAERLGNKAMAADAQRRGMLLTPGDAQTAYSNAGPPSRWVTPEAPLGPAGARELEPGRDH